MDRPFCKLCGAKHWSNEPHKFAKPAVASAPESSPVSRAPKNVEKMDARPHDAAAPKSDNSLQLIPGEPCPTWGKRVGQTSAERMRRHRAKARE